MSQMISSMLGGAIGGLTFCFFIFRAERKLIIILLALAILAAILHGKGFF